MFNFAEIFLNECLKNNSAYSKNTLSQSISISISISISMYKIFTMILVLFGSRRISTKHSNLLLAFSFKVTEAEVKC